jgi:hypothetical protein
MSLPVEIQGPLHVVRLAYPVPLCYSLYIPNPRAFPKLGGKDEFFKAKRLSV